MPDRVKARSTLALLSTRLSIFFFFFTNLRPRPSAVMALNLLRASAVRSARLGGTVPVRISPARSYATAHVQPKPSSNTPWFIGSLIVFGPLLFKLTSPPPKKAKPAVEHVAEPSAAAPEQPATATAVPESPKIQKPYVLIGAGTASFAAAQAIKEKEPNANVCLLLTKI